MSIPEDVSLEREATSLKAIIAGGALTLIGVVGAGLSNLISSPWAQNVALALATTLVSTGALSLLFELNLRRSVSREMLRLVSIQRSLLESQIVAAGKVSTIKWENILKNRTKYDVILSDPTPWTDQNFYLLLDSGRQQRIEAVILMPDPDGDYLGTLASYLEIDKDTFRALVKEALSKIERQWKAKRDNREIVAGSSIQLRLLERSPYQNIIMADDKTVLTVTGAVGRHAADQDFGFIYSGDRDRFPSTWFSGQTRRLGQSAIHFQDEVK